MLLLLLDDLLPRRVRFTLVSPTPHALTMWLGNLVYARKELHSTYNKSWMMLIDVILTMGRR